MHELAIIEEAVGIAVDTAKSAGAKRVVSLRLQVGELSGVVAEALHFAFDVACRGTIAEGARLDIELVTATCWCATCQAEFVCKDLINECPRCLELSDELRSGRELEIASVELE